MLHSLARHRHHVIASALVAVGVGAAASVLTVLRALSPLGLPYPDADRLVVARVGGPSWSPAMFDAVTASSTVLDPIAGFQERAATLTGDAAAEIARLESVSVTYFDLLGARPTLGRLFGRDEDRRGGSAAIAVISERLWVRRFGRDPGILGKALTVDGRALAVIGVMPARFGGLIGRTDIWTPLGSARWLSGDTGPERPSSRWFEVIARRPDGVTHEAAQARFAVEARAAIASIPAAGNVLTPTTVLTLTPLAQARVPRVFPQAARVLAVAVGVVLVLVIVNVTGIQLIRLDARRRELAIRQALGATAGQVAAMAVREAGVIAAAGAAGAILLRPIMLSAFAAIQPVSTSFGIVTSEVLSASAFELDVPTIAVAVVLSCVASLPLALAMLLSARRLDVERTLRTSSAAGMGTRRGSFRPTRTALLTLQAALACTVVGGGALLTRSASALLGQDRGYDTTGVTIAHVTLPSPSTASTAARFYDDVVARIAARPGVEHASVSSCAPGGGRCRRSNISRVDGRPVDPSSQATVGINYVTPTHLATIGATIAAGRSIADADRSNAPAVVLISEPLAAALWPGESPVGRTIEIYTANGSLNGDRTVVGTVRRIAFNLEADPGFDVFLPAAQASWTSGVIFVKSGLGSAAATDPVSLAAGPLVTVVAVLAGVAVPAWRASRAQPMHSMRIE